MIVHVLNNITDQDLGSFEVASPSELKMLAAVDYRPIEIDGEMRGFRFHGYRWDRRGDELVGYLYVSEGT